MGHSRYMGVTSSLLLAIALSWAGKVLFAFWVPSGVPESILLAIVVLLCNAAAVWTVSAAIRYALGDQSLRKGRPEWLRILQGSTLVALLLSMAHVLPFLPDGMALAARETQFRTLLPYAVLTLIFVAAIAALTLSRVLVFSIVATFVRPVRSGFLLAIPFSLFWALSDALWIRLFPLAFWGAIAPPVPMVPNVAEELLGSSKLDVPLTKVVLVNPRIGDVAREMMFLKGQEGQQELASKIALAWYSKRHLPMRSGDALLFVLPETTMLLEPSGMRLLFFALRDLLTKRVPDVELSILMGTQYGSLNAVMWAGEQPGTKWPLAGVLKIKDHAGRVPFFERPTMGISVRGGSQDDGQSLSFDDWLPEEEVAMLPPFLLPKRQLICYEALDPERWEFFSPRIVFTNHNLFAKYRLMSRTYDANLRLLASVFAAPLVLVGNDGATGVHSWMPQRLLRFEGQRRVEVEILELPAE